jgi:hypothetical protein
MKTRNARMVRHFNRVLVFALIAVSSKCFGQQAAHQFAPDAVGQYKDGAGVHPFVKAEISYYGWNVLTRSRLSLDDVRKHTSIKTTIYTPYEVTSFLTTLRLDKMTKSSDGAIQQGDPRLVVDLWDLQGIRTTYYSDGRLLISEDGLQWRKVDEAFRQKFTFVQKK